jgi:hypothetical protein
MKKTYKITIWIILFILILIISFIVFKHEAWENETSENKSSEYEIWKYEETEEPKICCNNTCFNIEIAADNESRKLWLMYRESLWDNEW